MAVKLDLRNRIINGSFEYWQRGTSFASPIADGTYTADRWLFTRSAGLTGTFAISRSTDVPSSAFGVYSIYADCTALQSSIASTDYATISQRIEGNVLRAFKGKKMVLSFWVKATKTGTYCVSLRNDSRNRSLIKEYTVSASNTWEQKIIRFVHDPTGTWLYDTGIGMRVSFALAAGSTFQVSADNWQNGDYYATSNQVNAIDSASNDFKIADVCLVEDNDGQTRTPDFTLAGRDIFQELQLCQRYYESTYVAGEGYSNAWSNSSTGSNYWQVATFKISKRIVPLSITFPSSDSSMAFGTFSYSRFGVINNYTGGFGRQWTWAVDTEL